MKDVNYAKALLVGEIRCAVISNEQDFVSDRRGIAPLLELVRSGKDFENCVAADRIVGKAAALLYAKLGAKEIYAEVLSKAAIPVLNRFGINYTFLTLTDYIINRRGDDICPMEKTVKDISEPDEAVAALEKTVAALRAKG